MNNSIDPAAVWFTVGALLITGAALLFAAWLSDRLMYTQAGLPPRRERRRQFPSSPEETARLAELEDLPADEAVLEAWMYSGEPTVSYRRWRERRDLVRACMPVLARNLDRLVREWGDRHEYFVRPAKPYRPGITEHDHRGALYGVALSWTNEGQGGRWHRARVADVRHAHPALAAALDRLVRSGSYHETLFV